jgi:hypothetical protein
VNKEEKEGEEDKHKQGEVTPPRNPLDEVKKSKKRNVSPTKPTSRKKSKASKPKLQTMVTVDSIDLIIVVVSDTSEDILQCNEEKQESMYDRIKEEIRGINMISIQAVQFLLCRCQWGT